MVAGQLYGTAVESCEELLGERKLGHLDLAECQKGDAVNSFRKACAVYISSSSATVYTSNSVCP